MRKAIAAFFVSAAFATANAQNPQIQIDKNNRTITITTSDEASKVADFAVLTVGYKVSRPTAQEAYAEGAKLSNDIFAALTDASVSKDSVESAGQNLSEQDDDSNPKKGKVVLFQFSQGWKVKVPSAAVAKTMDAAIKAGANDTGETEWNVLDEDALQARAAESALAKARAIATQMAQGLNVKIGSLLYASNESPRAVITTSFSMEQIQPLRHIPPPPSSAGVGRT